VSLGVYREGEEIGRLERQSERSREYAFRYTRASRPVSLALPLRRESFSPAESRPFFEALLPEGDVRERIAGQLKLAAGDSYGLLAALGGDCAGALQILDAGHPPATPSVLWLAGLGLDALGE
jgi:serine/threonine-protein kinase HipA